MRLFWLALLTVLCSVPGHARWLKFETFRLQPVDESERDATFHDFRVRFSRALEARDTQTLLSLVSDDIVLSLQSKRTGKKNFIKDWRLEGKDAWRSPIWDSLRDTVKLGGSFRGNEFLAPYVYSRWPAQYPHLDFYAVLVKNAKLYAKPNENSRVLETLTQEIVGRFDEIPNQTGWRAVRSSNGTTGYMLARETRSPLDYRAIFGRVKGEWRLKLFAVGDWEANERLE